LRESVSSAGERIQVIIEAAEKAAAGIIEDADAQARRYIDTSRQRADVLADERVRVMSDLTDTLIRQAEMVRRQSDELLAALDSARGELASRIGQELSSGTAAPAGVPPAPTQDQPPAQAPRVPHLQPVESERPGLQAVEPPAQAEEPPAAPQPTPQAQPPQSPSPGPPQSAPQPPQDTAPAAPPPPSGAQSAATIPSDGARLLAAQMAVAGSSREEIETRLRDEFGIQDAGPILDGILGPG
jgi:vacuolar-type H+-ATPase subunit H